MEGLIGDYQQFFANLLSELKKSGIDIKGLPISHIAYRVTTLTEYERLRDAIKNFCDSFAQTQFKGRSVSLLHLKTTLVLANDFSTSLIELPAPREGRSYPDGIEHVGFIVGKGITEFKTKYKDKLTGEKDRDYYTIPFITFESGITAKFYEKPLEDIVESEGWQFSKI